MNQANKWGIICLLHIPACVRQDLCANRATNNPAGKSSQGSCKLTNQKNPQTQHFPWRRTTSTNATRTWRVCKKSLFAKTAVKQNLCLSPKTDSKQQTSQTQEAAPCWMLSGVKGRAAITCNAGALGLLLAACLCPLKSPVGGKGRLPLLRWKADLHPLTRDGSAGLEKTAKRESPDWKNRVQIIWRSCTSSQIKCWLSLQREC